MKKILIIIGLAAFAGVLFSTYLFYKNPNFERLNFIQRHITKTIADKWIKKLEEIPKEKRAVVDYELLMNELGFFQRNFTKRIFSIKPEKLGFLGPFYSKERPGELIQIDSRKVGGRETGIQFCPAHSFWDYQAMMEAMEKDIGKRLYIDSGYRSPGRQAYLFFYYLAYSADYSLLENARWIAMPGYSEHGHPVNHAIDFTSKEGINGFSSGQSPEDFEALPEYDWLLMNANRFNFYISYPRGNKLGVAFEPWHWHWEGD